MADMKVKAVLGIARFLLACVIGYAIYYYWQSFRQDEWFIPILAGAVSALFAFIMLLKLKGGGD